MKKQTTFKLFLRKIFGLEGETKTGLLFFYTLFFLYTGAMLYLFIMQCYEIPYFNSDMHDYVNKVAGVEGIYEFPYPVFFSAAGLFAWFLNPKIAVAVTTMLFNSMALLMTKFYMNRQIRPCSGYSQKKEKGRTKTDIAVSLLTLSLFCISNLYGPQHKSFFGFDYTFRCGGIYTPNPYWNATYLAARLFALICFFEAADLLKEYRSFLPVKTADKSTSFFKNGFLHYPWKRCLPFAVSLLLLTMTKPSYTVVIVPVIGIILLVHLISSRGKSFYSAFLLCVTMIPTGLDLLYQFFGVFTGTNSLGEETGVGFAPGAVWHMYSINIPLSIFMGMALPLCILVFNLNEFWKNHLYRFSWYGYLAGTVIFYFLYEKGFRMRHANFAWSYMYGMFFVFFMSFVLLFQNTKAWRKTKKAILLLPEWGLFLFHLVCGCNFLWYALQGKSNEWGF